MICNRLDNRLHFLKNTNPITSVHQNIDIIPQLPMNQIEDINNFEHILISEEAQSQFLVCIAIFNHFNIIRTVKNI